MVQWTSPICQHNTVLVISVVSDIYKILLYYYYYYYHYICLLLLIITTVLASLSYCVCGTVLQLQ